MHTADFHSLGARAKKSKRRNASLSFTLALLIFAGQTPRPKSSATAASSKLSAPRKTAVSVTKRLTKKQFETSPEEVIAPTNKRGFQHREVADDSNIKAKTKETSSDMIAQITVDQTASFQTRKM